MAKTYKTSVYLQLIYLFFVSLVTQFVVAIAYFPYIIIGFAHNILRNGYLNFEEYQSGYLWVISAALLIFLFFIFLFKKFTIDTRILSEKPLLFLVILIMNVIVHNFAFLHMYFPYFISFVSLLSVLQMHTVIHARNNVVTNRFAWIPMVIGGIGGIIMVLHFFPFIWLGETILKLTNHQFNLFWFDYSGTGFIYLSLCTSILYFVFNHIISFFSKQ